MLFRILSLMLLIFSLTTQVEARRPAVEDFVGIEPPETEFAPQGTGELFNLEQDLKEARGGQKPQGPSQVVSIHKSPNDWSPFTIFGISMAAGLPLLIWFMVMGHLRQKATLESASNIAVLEKYRLQREEARRKQEDGRKAS